MTIRVLVVDDSATMRGLITLTLQRDPEIGAVDCIGKTFDNNGFEQLCDKVKMAARSRVRAPRAAAPAAEPRAPFTPGELVVAIGSSTGGVEALLTLLSQFSANCPPTLITQHMPAVFTTRFAERLDRICAPHVAEARDGEAVQPGCIYLAPGHAHLELVKQGGLRCRLSDAERVSGHRPSVDVLFHSVARVCQAKALGVILTGMGRDGAQGLAELRRQGAPTIGQDEASCVVYGMPKTAFELGAVMHQLPLEKIADRILHLTRAPAKEKV